MLFLDVGLLWRLSEVDARFVDITALSQSDRARWRDMAQLDAVSAPFVDDVWMDCWISAYGPREPVLLCGRTHGALVGVAPLQRLTERWAGRDLTVLQSLTNVETPRYAFAASCPNAYEQLWDALGTEPWDVIRLEYVAEDSPTLRAALSIADERGWNRVLQEQFSSPWRLLRPAGATWDEGLSRKFKSNLRNRERRLQTLGPLTFEVKCGDGALQTFYELEASGWKAQRGTAIAQRQNVKGFYDRMVARAGEQVWLPILSVNGRAAAAQVVRIAGNTMFLLKTAYHPDFAPYAPGQLATARLIQFGIANDLEILDFMGVQMIWKADWEPQLRRHFHLLLFAPTANGRYAYWTHHGVRESARKVPGLERVVRWVRACV